MKVKQCIALAFSQRMACWCCRPLLIALLSCTWLVLFRDCLFDRLQAACWWSWIRWLGSDL